MAETRAVQTIVTSSPQEAAAFIRRGQLAAFPTETVYGLGADAENRQAVTEIFRVKGRPADNPLIIHVADSADVFRFVRHPSEAARTLIRHFFPGPLTLVLLKSDRIPHEATAGLETVAIRCPAHPVAIEFLSECGRPVAAPSANRSGRPSPTSWQSVLEDLDGLIPCILEGGRSPVGLESTVVDCTEPEPTVLRQGAVSIERIREVLPARESVPGSAASQRSPGTRYRHYAPTASVTFHSGEKPGPRSAYIGLTAPPDRDSYAKTLICRDTSEYAYELFHFFRECDRLSIQTIYCERPEPTGLGAALLDRINQAARSRVS